MNPRVQAVAMLASATLFWGGNAVSSVMAVGHISPLLLVTARWALALIIAWPFAKAGLRRDWPVLKTRIPYIFIMGGLGFTLFNSLFYIAAQTTTAINIGIIQGSIPIIVLVFGALLFKHGFGLMQLLGVILTFTGVVVVTFKGDWLLLLGLELGSGDGLMLVACCAYASYTLGLSKSKRPQADGLSLYYAFAVAALIWSLPGVAYEYASGSLITPDLLGWALIGYIAIFPSFISQVFFVKGVDIIGPARAGVFINLVPIYAPLLAIAILGEMFFAFHGAGLGLVLLGIALSESTKNRP